MRHAEVITDAQRSRIVLQLTHPQPASLHSDTTGPRLQLADTPQAPSAPAAENNAEAVLAHRFANPTSSDYNGSPLTLNFQQIETRRALEILAEFTGLNIIASDSVQGSVTLRLNEVPWDQALDVILQARGLAMRGHGNVVWVAPAGELAALNEAASAAANAEPLVYTQIPVNYAQAEEIAVLIEGDRSHLLSARGSLRVDKRSNTLLIRDTETQLALIRDMLKTLDAPAQQVLIESRIVIASDDFTRSLGVKFGVQKVPGDQTGWEMGVSGTAANASSALGGTTPTLSSSDNSRLAVNLPATSAVGTLGLAIGKLPVGVLLDLELSAAKIEGLTEIVANPRVITTNGKEAMIQQGLEIPYSSATGEGNTTTEFKEAVMELKVVPRITPDGQVIMDLSVKKDAAGSILCTGCEPSVDTREIKTQVMIADGETLVIGGIYEEMSTRNENKVPLLGDLPLVGGLFRNKYDNNQKDELLVFVTPRILRSGQSAPNERKLQMHPIERPAPKKTITPAP